MSNSSSIKNSLRTLEIFQGLDDIQIEKISLFFSEEKISMGEPILFPDVLNDKLLILISGQVRQLVEHPARGNTITLSLYNPNHIIGLPSYQANKPIELITAATDCILLKINISDWRKLEIEFPENVYSANNKISSSDVWPLIPKNKDIVFPDTTKDFKKWVENLSLQSETIIVNSFQDQPKNLDASKIWFIASQGDNNRYGAEIDSEAPLLLESDDFPVRFIGIPLLKSDDNLQILLDKTQKVSNDLIDSDNLKSKPQSSDDIKVSTEKSHADEKSLTSKYKFYSSAKEPISEAIACFRIIGDYLNLPIKVDLIRRSFTENIDPEKDIITLPLCAAIGESLGLNTQILELPFGLLERIQTPSLLELKNNELAVLLDIKNDDILIARPHIGLETYKLSELIELTTDQIKVPVLILRTTERTPKKRFGLKWFLPAIKKNRKPLTDVLIASLFVQLFQLMNPLIIQQLIDKVMGQNAINTLGPLAVLLFSFSIFENILTAVRTNLFIDTTNRIDISLGEQVIDHLLRLPLPYFDQRSVGELSSRIAELEQIRNFLTGTALTVVLDAVFSVIYIGVMLLYSWILTLVALIVAPLLAFITILVSPVIRRQLRSKAEFNAKTQNHLVEVLTGIQTVKAQNFELQARWKWKQRYSKYISESFRNTITSTTSNSLTQFLNQTSGLSILCVGSYLVLNGELTLGQLIAFRIIGGYVTAPLLRLSNLYQNFQQTNISLERLSDIINTEQESTEIDKLNIPMPSIKGSIAFENVSFRFQKKGPLNLSNVNFEIEAGKFVAIVGESGSGKSTLTKLIARLYDPTQGKISIDNMDLSKVELYSLRRQIGIVPQDSILFDGSVQDNISLTNPEASVEDIISAAKIASADNFIMELPSGYASSVGERGTNLSGGQRQRIAIARSVLQNPKLLIMDESTSALDFETERKVSLNLREYFEGKTVLFITHRLNSILHADIIITMHKGRIEEVGNHDELMSMQGRYFSLYKQQEKVDVDVF
ncbi:peptidase domain-containing ABC transporter [Prochlorococcus marinus]|uniref:peptidase domain-containing ABC transporter n=1 Tax=Prochlorococcus marinus TaxID=1219 RepID=UPI0022B31AAF|nr:peptidase domain-containing ABC transporter [Prochlorococcus marinus]